MITRKINNHPREKRGNKNSSQATIGQAKDVLHRNLSSYMQHGYAYYRMITDEDNHVDFVYEEVNESYAKLTGLRDVIGKRMTEARPGLAKSSPMFIEKYARVAETGIPDKFEIFIDTENHWYDVSLFSPQKGYVLSMFDDISTRKLAENQLRKLSVAVEQSPAIVVMTDPLGNIEYVNPMFTEVTGYSADEARGQNPRILKSGLMPQSVYEELWRTILSGDVWHGELQNKKKNGSGCSLQGRRLRGIRPSSRSFATVAVTARFSANREFSGWASRIPQGYTVQNSLSSILTSASCSVPDAYLSVPPEPLSSLKKRSSSTLLSILTDRIPAA